MILENNEKYNFSDFTHEHYEVLLKTAKSKFSFSFYESEMLVSENPMILWRHDVDFSMHEALNLARIENRNGVYGTYFLLMHSEFYNLFESSIAEKVKAIIKLGHRIGLHFDTSFYNIKTRKELEDKLIVEKEFLEKMFLQEITVFSFHNPTPSILEFDEWNYGGMINTYSKEIKDNFSYCSDSNGYWRFSRMLDALTNDQSNNMQALTHPEWWTEQIMSPKEKVWRCVDKRAEKSKLFYEEGIKKYGRTIIDWM